MKHVHPTEQQSQNFAELGRKGPLHMLNLVRLHEWAQYPDRREVSGKEAYRSYTRESAPVFARVGGKIHWTGRFECTLIGPSEERWDVAFIAAYPSAGAFQAMLADPIYQQAVKHREAAVAESRLIRFEP
jgi:uncharacterized protein (DUF1330 family)